MKPRAKPAKRDVYIIPCKVYDSLNRELEMYQSFEGIPPGYVDIMREILNRMAHVIDQAPRTLQNNQIAQLIRNSTERIIKEAIGKAALKPSVFVP